MNVNYWVAGAVAFLCLGIGFAVGRFAGKRRSAAALTLTDRPVSSLAPFSSTAANNPVPRGSRTGQMTIATLLDLVVREFDNGVVVVDEHRDVVLFNRRAESLSLVNELLLDNNLWRVVNQVLTSGEEIDFDLTFDNTGLSFAAPPRNVGRPVIAVHCRVRIVTDGRDRFAVVYGLDNSENMRVENTRRDFVANVSHELKTPVGAIVLLTEALLESVDDPESAQHFGNRVLGEAKRMGNMVNELIALSRLQGAEKLPDLGVVDVDEIVVEVFSNAQVLAEAKNITLDIDDTSGLLVRGDYTLLMTALNNLVANAIAYSAPDTIVSVSRRIATVNEQKMVSIGVTDRGMGIAAADQERVFERFFRVDKARSRMTGGTGLGLAIVKHVALNHGGNIELWSKLGTGSTFTLSIPVPDERESDATAQLADLTKDVKNKPTPRWHNSDQNTDYRILEQRK